MINEPDTVRSNPRTPAPEIRSWLVTQIADYLLPEQRAHFVQGLSRELRCLFEQPPGDRQAWVPLAHFAQALEVADSMVGRGDLAACWDIGRFTAAHESGVVRSFALKFFRPATVMSLAASLWRVHYRNAGRVVVQVAGAQGVTASIVDYPRPHRAHCLAVGGWVQGALELGPRRGVSVEKTACRCDGARSCDYRVRWEEA